MSENLLQAGFVMPRLFPVNRLKREVAKFLDIYEGNILEVQCWQNQLWVNIKEVGGRLVSYRCLPIWQERILYFIKNCNNFSSLTKLAADAISPTL